MKVFAVLNHIYLVVAAPAFQSIKNNSFLRQHFAHIEHKIVDGKGGDSWEGIYIWGEETYIELLAPQKSGPRAKAGITGVGLGVDESADVDPLHHALQGALPHVNIGTYTRHVTGAEKKWFTFITQKNSYSIPNHSLWAMAYHPAYTGHNDISRKTYNAPFYDPTKLFKNVTDIKIAVAGDAQAAYVHFLQAAGFDCTEIKKHHHMCQGSKIRIEIIPETRHAIGLQEVTCTLNTSVERQQHQIGDSKLTLERATGHWDFRH